MSRSAMGICFFNYVFFGEKKIMNPHILKILDFLPKYILWIDMVGCGSGW